MIAPVLHTNRLTLGPLRMVHWPYIALFFESTASATVGGPIDRHRAWFLFAADAGCWSLRGFGPFAVEDSMTGAFIGYVGVNQPDHVPEPELGWVVLPAHQRRGYATEAAIAARDHAFQTLGLNTMVSYVDPANRASVSVAERLGGLRDKLAVNPYPGGIVFRHRGRTTPSPDLL